MTGDETLPGATPLSPAMAEESPEPAAPGSSAALERPDPSVPARLEAPLPEPAADDAPWARTFGAITVAAYPGAIAVRGEEVYLGGEFTLQMAGMPDYTYVRIAHWDGIGWRRMGEGVDGTVRAIAVVGEEVHAGGEFAAAGGAPAAGLARWDGTGWSAVAGGVRSSVSWIQASVRALASDGARLYVAGVFDSVGPEDDPVAANGFAVLDIGSGAWETYDGGLWSAGEPGEGRALALAGDRVYVGGSFDRAGAVETAGFAVLDLPAGRWERLGAGVRNGDLAGTVDSLAVDESTGTVFIGGRFTHADTVETSGVATFSGGEFGTLGGLTYYDGTTGVNVVALAHAGGRLHAAGEFTAAGGVPAQHWVMHDGTAWSVPAEVSNAVLALAAYGDGVVVAGTFGYSGALSVPHAGIWTPAGWQTFGQGVAYDPYADTSVFALAATDSGVYAGGYFDQVGPVPVGSVAEWRDGTWRDMAGGVQSPSALGEIFAMLAVGDDLYVTGQFETAGGVAAANIARWDGERWWPLGAGIQGMGLALAVLAGRLYVGGAFYLAGDVPAYNVASWDPATETWSAVGSAPVYDGRVLALAALRDRYLAVGGGFTKLYAGRFQVSNLNSIVLFDTHAPPEPANPWAGYSRLPGVTTSWMAGVVQAMRVIGDDLYIGGEFSEAGVEAWADPPVEGFPAANLVVWRYRGGEPGKEWSAPDGTDHIVTAFDTLDGRSLVVGGWFGSAGGIPAGAVAELDPATGAWTTCGSGIGFGARGGRQVQALAQSAAAGLWVGGTFTVAGGAPSCGVALWQGTEGRAP